VPGALDGYRIIDITTIVLGPYGTQLLGDMGADIIKVEAPPGGDIFRHAGRGRSPGMSGPFLNMNRNKRSICLDLKQESARDALRRLIEGADALVHNMRTKAIEKLGFGYEAVRAIRPDIVYCACGGFSESGPYAGKPAYDDLIQALSGITDLAKTPEAGEPRFAPTVLVDKLTGLMMSQAVTAAMLHRERTGEGQYVEVPMFETMVSFLMAEHIYGHAFEPPLGPLGYSRLTTPNRKPNRSKDGWIAVLPYTDKQWLSFFELSGHSDLKADPRFADAAGRAENVHELYGILAGILLEKTSAEWLALCDEAEIPAAPILALEDVMSDPHLQAVGMFQHLHHPTEGDTVITRPPVGFSASPAEIRRQAPRLGEQGAEILAEAGFAEEEVAGLRASGALYEAGTDKN
jgi:crotonobetainyl-CoA:carnitine CoA-transferase CaiB-like acyl-CoA transferase